MAVVPLTATVQFTAHFEVVEGGWIQAQLQELPGVITAAPTLPEAKAMLVDALREYLLALGSPESDEIGNGEQAAIQIVISAA